MEVVFSLGHEDTVMHGVGLPPSLPQVSQPPMDERTVDSLALFRAFRETGSPETRERLILTHSPLARYLARKYARHPDMLSDLTQVAYIGLIHAVDRFDPDRGAAFSTFAARTIVGEIQRFFRDTGWTLKVSRPLQDLALKVRARKEELNKALGRAPSLEELARDSGLTEEEVLQALDVQANARYVLSLDTPQSQGGEEGGLDRGWRRAEDESQMEQWFASFRLRQAIAELTPREKRVILLRFFHDLTQSEIARQLGCSQMQVSRIQRQALQRLKQSFAE